MATEIDPVSSMAAGFAHEVDNSAPPGLSKWIPGRFLRHAEDNWHGQGAAERNMDLHNNLEGIRAALAAIS